MPQPGQAGGDLRLTSRARTQAGHTAVVSHCSSGDGHNGGGQGLLRGRAGSSLAPREPIARYFWGGSASEWTPAGWNCSWSCGQTQCSQATSHCPPTQATAQGGGPSAPGAPPNTTDSLSNYVGPATGGGETSGPEWVLWSSGPMGAGQTSQDLKVGCWGQAGGVGVMWTSEAGAPGPCEVCVRWEGRGWGPAAPAPQESLPTRWGM